MKEITFECSAMSLCCVKEEPPGDLDPNQLPHVEMTFECLEEEQLSDVKEEHTFGAHARLCLKFDAGSVNVNLGLEGQAHAKTNRPNVGLDVKVEPVVTDTSDGGYVNKKNYRNILVIKSSVESKVDNADVFSESKSIDTVFKLQEEKGKIAVDVQKSSMSHSETLNFDSKKTVFDCSLCGKLFRSLETLRKHAKIHIQGKSYRCEVCNKMFALQSYLKRHKTIHVSENKKLTCEYCLKKFSDNIRLRQHRNQVHFSTDRKYRCDVCSKTFKLEGALKCHVQTHSSAKPYTCNICNSAFSTHTTLIHHRKIHTEAKPFTCSFCGRGFLRLFHLKNHSAVHTGIKAFQCIICGKKFGHSSSLKQHQLVHTGERFACNICGKTYSRPAHMRLHVARAHTKVKKYSCEVCSGKFYTTGELLLHLRAHIGEKPFGCGVCKKTFVTLFRRDQHSQVHTNNKRYQCEACGKQYYTLKRLKGHVDRHRTQES